MAENSAPARVCACVDFLAAMSDAQQRWRDLQQAKKLKLMHRRRALQKHETTSMSSWKDTPDLLVTESHSASSIRSNADSGSLASLAPSTTEEREREGEERGGGDSKHGSSGGWFSKHRSDSRALVRTHSSGDIVSRGSGLSVGEDGDARLLQLTTKKRDRDRVQRFARLSVFALGFELGVEPDALKKRLPHLVND